MSIDYQTLKFAYRPRAERDAGRDAAIHPVIVVGAGPVGLSAAIDLAQQGVPVVLLDDDDTLSTGSRAICFAKRTLEIFDRLGCGERFVDKGVSWHVGKVFLQDEQLYAFDLLPEAGHARPAFINLQQYYVEGYLAERAFALPNLDIRWKHKVTGVAQTAEHATVTVETPEGVETLRARYVIAADGSRSPMRTLMGLESHGRTFKDRFLIADVKMKAEFPTERWFWFDPPFHAGQSALLHRQPDNVWRIDLQLGRDADAAAERQPDKVRPRIARMLGHDDFAFEWISIYKFQCRRMQRFVHERVIFAGDAAHQVSPFGARGANSGLEDAENIAWKLAAVLRGAAPASLLASYDLERGFAADDNIRASTHATDFMAPPSPQEQRLRQAVLALAKETEFAKRMINGGRLSVPSVYPSPLSTADDDAWRSGPCPGTHMPDVPLTTDDGAHVFLSECFATAGRGFTMLQTDASAIELPDGVARLVIGDDAQLRDSGGLFKKRYGADPGTAYLLRPDGYVAARFQHPTSQAVAAAFARASGRA